jgi:5'(3')-deoxyribonucleotidase
MRLLDIGLDVDGCMYSSFEQDLHHFSINVKGEKLPEFVPWKTWDQWSEWGWEGDKFRAMCDEATDSGQMFIHGKPIGHVIEVVNRLYEAGHRIHIITARDFGTKSPHNTTDWLHANGIPFDSAMFVHDKFLVRPDIMLDDHERNFREMWDVGVETWLYSQPWNEHIKTEYRVNDWLEFEEAVNRKAAT